MAVFEGFMSGLSFQTAKYSEPIRVFELLLGRGVESGGAKMTKYVILPH